ncbi:uncharacterized protein PHALS_03644 [Plasmopara halstedii]|uniref:Uncharacterized protein n=1 Tax=Plasmopara halstedii TaxID=4781 RepID=A0A0P1AZ45_PLAHL|nr:uncharacterized protein PHALS_03644 [Plasmopara halstedii]CEG46976.1 hypothetical protein PHALS_03644 [Plasmopara halstedii]|eukprot:XP_024583345.1 hypothetical protein PHALS_03644 [Plasmopara halstedii]
MQEMFEVQIVRRRNVGSGLQALRRRFYMAVSDQNLTITVKAPSLCSFAVLSISSKRIKVVRVRGKILRVVAVSGNALTVRLRDQTIALRAAEIMMNTWGIDPLVETSDAKTNREPQCGIDDIIKFYMNDCEFRQLVHEIHNHLESVLSREGWVADV